MWGDQAQGMLDMGVGEMNKMGLAQLDEEEESGDDKDRRRDDKRGRDPRE